MTSSEKSGKEDESSSSSNVHKQKKDHAPCLQVLQSMQESFAKAIDYCTYRLKNKSQRYNSKIASEVAKLVMKVWSQLKRRILTR